MLNNGVKRITTGGAGLLLIELKTGCILISINRIGPYHVPREELKQYDFPLARLTTGTPCWVNKDWETVVSVPADNHNHHRSNLTPETLKTVNP